MNGIYTCVLVPVYVYQLCYELTLMMHLKQKPSNAKAVPLAELIGIKQSL